MDYDLQSCSHFHLSHTPLLKDMAMHTTNRDVAKAKKNNKDEKKRKRGKKLWKQFILKTHRWGSVDDDNDDDEPKNISDSNNDEVIE